MSQPVAKVIDWSKAVSDLIMELTNIKCIERNAIRLFLAMCSKNPSIY